MHIKTARFELDPSRSDIFVGLTFGNRRWETFRDFTGQGLSATSVRVINAS